MCPLPPEGGAHAAAPESARQPQPACLAAQGARGVPAGSAARDFLAVATPGAGKTTFALRIAAELFADDVDAVTVVAPTEHLKAQWAVAAAQVGIHLDPTFRNADVHSSADFHGAVVTYAQVGTAPQVHRRRTMTGGAWSSSTRSTTPAIPAPGATACRPPSSRPCAGSR